MRFIPIVLCAGFGTRLRPLTHYVPKPVVPVGNLPVAYRSIRQLLIAGAPVVHCNTHYLSEMVESELRAALRDDGFEQCRIRFWHEPEILETGGGIGRIVHELCTEERNAWSNRDIIAIAGDVFANPPLDAMIERWEKRPPNTCALMSTRTLKTTRPDVTWVDTQKNEVVGFGKDITEQRPHLETRVFSTHQILSHEIVTQAGIVRESSRDIFFRAGLKKGLRILNVNYPDSHPWYDIGDYASLTACAESQTPEPSAPLSCLLLARNNAPLSNPWQLKPTKLSVGIVHKLRSPFQLLSGETLSSRVSQLLNQASSPQSTESLHLNIPTGTPQLVVAVEACPVNLPSPLLVSLETLEGSPSQSLDESPTQSSSTFFLFPSSRLIT